MSRFWSDTTRNLTPYVPGEQPQGGGFIKLNTNENPYPPAPGVEEVLRTLPMDMVKLYPDPVARELRGAMADFYGTQLENVFVGNGSDEVLAFLFHAFFGRTDRIAFPDITYSFYPVYARLYGIPYQTVPLTADWRVDLQQYPKDLKGIVLANPNAPTGINLPEAAIEAALQERPDTLIVVDEAYADFGGTSVVPLVQKYENLLVVKTMSKSRSFAGLRVGYAIGQAPLMEGLIRVKDSFNSYPVDVLAQRAATASFRDRAYFLQKRDQLVSTRETFISRIVAAGVRVLPSSANFVFASVPGWSGDAVLRKLREDGILVRHFDKPRLSDWVRISIGTEEQMTRCAERMAGMIEVSRPPR